MKDPKDMTDSEFELYAAGVEKGIALAVEHGQSLLFITEFDNKPIIGGFLATESASKGYIRRLTEERKKVG